MRNLLAIFTIITLAFIGTPVGAAAPDVQYPPGYDYTCPAGTYPIGNGICKKEPSGCPFYENIDAKGCVKPPYIDCTDDTWSNCWLIDDTTAAPNAPQSTQPTKTTPTPTPAPNTPKTTPNASNTGNYDAPYAPPVANNTTNVNKTAKTVDVAHDDVNKKAAAVVPGVPDTSDAPIVDTKKVEEFGVAMIEIVIVLMAGAVTIAAWVWAEARHPGFTRNGIDDLKSRIKTRIDEFTKRR